MMHEWEGKVTPVSRRNSLKLSISWDNVKITQHKEISSQDFQDYRLFVLSKFFYYAGTTIII